MHEAYSELEINHNIELYPDAEIIHNFNFNKILVTTGYKKLQESKIEKLGLKHLFNQILIDDLDSNIRINKKQIFLDIIEKFPNHDLIIIGDNLNSEIKFGNQLKLITVYINRKNNKIDNLSTYTIFSLNEIFDIFKFVQLLKNDK